MTAIDFTTDERSELRIAIRAIVSLYWTSVLDDVARGRLASAYAKIAVVDGVSPTLIVEASPRPSLSPVEGMRAIGEIANGIVEHLQTEMEAEQAATEQAAADLGDKMARFRRA